MIGISEIPFFFFFSILNTYLPIMIITIKIPHFLISISGNLFFLFFLKFIGSALVEFICFFFLVSFFLNFFGGWILGRGTANYNSL